MKTIRYRIMASMVITAVLLTAGALPSYGQTNLNFKGVSATIEGAIRLSWNSTSNEIYGIDYADSLIDTNTGSITWQNLYSQYPSHGTNTFIADCGNYDLSPEISHPKFSPMRFYRIRFLGTNDGAIPTVSISSPTNGAELSGEVTISVNTSSSQNLTEVRLFIDGEEMWPSDDDTNFVVNTCEWDNGSHVLFATAKSESGFVGIPYGSSQTHGSAVSTYVNVTFNNLITRWDFSRPFFVPENGETQTVTAVFAANVDWTLEVQDDSSNTVRTVSGNGKSLSWNFDGKDDSSQLLTPGLYWYVLTAQTNEQAFSLMAEESMFSTESANDTQWLAMSPNSDSVVPLSLYPPGFDTNNLVIFEGSFADWMPSQRQSQSYSRTDAFGLTESSSSATAAAPSSQSSKGPQRKPKQRHIGVKGDFGVFYQDYPDGLYCTPPRKSLFPNGYVKLDGQPRGSSLANPPVPQSADIANAFITGMRNTGYTNKFNKGSGKWAATDLTGTGALINSVNFALVNTHASYAEDAQNPDGVLHTYIWLADGSYARLGDMRLGAGANALRWATFFTCDTLRAENITSYINHSLLDLVIDDNLHLLLGSQTIVSGNRNTSKFYAENLKDGMTIPNAWYDALRRAIAKAPNKPSDTRTARTLGHQPCFSDKIMDWADPDEGISSQSVQVYP